MRSATKKNIPGKAKPKPQKKLSLSIYVLVFFMTLASSTISTALLTGGWAKLARSAYRKDIERIRNNNLDTQVEHLKWIADNTRYLIEIQAGDTVEYSVEKVQSDILEFLVKIKFGNKGYVFVNTYDGYALIFDGKKLDQPVKMSELNFPDKPDFYKTEYELANMPDGGYFKYKFKIPGDTIQMDKISYIVGYEPWGWMIGAGEYLDNIDEIIENQKEFYISELRKQLTIASYAAFIVIAIMALVSAVIARGFEKQFNSLKDILGRHIPENKDTINEGIYIKELKSVSEELLKARELALQFSAIIDQLLNEVYLFRIDDLKILRANRGAIKNTGYSQKALLDSSFLEIQIAYNQVEFEHIASPLINGSREVITFETVHQRHDKSKYPVEVNLTISEYSGIPVFVAVISDITSRKAAEDEIMYSRQRYTNLFENAPISLWEEDFTQMLEYLHIEMVKHSLKPQDLLSKFPDILAESIELIQITNINSETVKLFEAESKEYLIKNLHRTFTPESVSDFNNFILMLLKGKESDAFEVRNVTLNGKEKILLFKWSVLVSQDSRKKKVILAAQDLTDLRLAEAELKESENRFRSVFNNNKVIMLLIHPKTGKFLDVNTAALKYYGYSKEDFLTRLKISDFSIDDIPDEEVFSLLKMAIQNRRNYLKFKHKIKNGEIRDVEVYLSPIILNDEDVLISVVHDISEKKLFQENLEATLNKMNSIFRAAPSGLAVIQDGKFLEINRKYSIITGFKKEELLGKAASIIFPSKEEYKLAEDQIALQIKKKGTGSIQSKYRKKDGTLIDVSLSAAPLDLKDPAFGITFTATDITQNLSMLKELEEHRSHLEELVDERTHQLEDSQTALLNLVDDLNQQSEKLKLVNQQLETKNKELETFTYSVSHDLKAPLRGIDGYSQLLLESYYEDLNEEAQDFLQKIRKSTTHMNTLIEDLLAYSRMERKEFEIKPVSLGKVVDEIVQSYDDILISRKIRVKKDFKKSLSILADQEGLRLVLRNVFDNAVKFTSNTTEPVITIGAEERDNHWFMYINDNGIGFDMKYHDKLFQIFQRLHLPEEYSGTGIGLAMVSKAIQRMNGKIYAESHPGKGATFYIIIHK